MSKAAKTGKKPQRSSSNVFANFDQQQIQEFKEAFTIIDQNRDGFIDATDLKDMWASLGRIQDDTFISGMVAEATGPINFTMFLTFMGDKLQNTDSDETLTNAFLSIDDANTGFIKQDKFTRCLSQMGDRFTKEEIEQMYNVAPMKGDAVNWKKFIKLIKYGGDFEDE